MSKLVTIYGGSGFVGRYIARRLAKNGWRIRVAVRRPNEALFVKTYGAVGQIEPIFCNIRDDESVRAALRGADAVVNCVGVLVREGRNTFRAVQAEGAGRIARIAAQEGVGRLVHLSAIGADAEGGSDYARTKAAGEQAVTEAFPGAVILRPSVIFGPEDGFFNRFASLSRFSPMLAIVGGKTRFQPVYVDDVAQAAVAGVEGRAQPGIYELGGPEVRTLRETCVWLLNEIRRRRLIVNLPFWLGALMGGAFDLLQTLSGGLLVNRILTRDQVRSLRHDNVVSDGARTLRDLGVAPTPFEAVVGDYLWRYRPAGQFEEITESARKLNKA
ncbi:3-beta-hydroxy-delta(5)-steroid dehydrogenase [Defluviimonas sp. 20V17]|uniref:3-beta-hydroxy-Delta(5)-steroid dehydrogenase n=1 Tax=Allgaiera indica TaxID=765699 RepID=A0AAN4UNC3_9RHOB|nr:complex I NDUFA9 subunit family protein [Allgaiera indica]KDB03560.1 3-beta-hydroxy-delta(5)-steroid dehydrogenase [Defluviimonas sp. 20V17]GHD98394.1 3-beta-hydroxy-Delta(5)-steroid dehydrogenase [Allgaiera indica]SDW48154.1 NADH dehydrogenase [Allgaiera indica]